MLIRPFKFFLEMDQSALSIVELGQVMLERVCYMLTIDFTRCTNMELDQSESQEWFKRTALGFLDIGHVDLYPDVDIHPDVDICPDVDILSIHQYEKRCMMEDASDSTQTSSCYEVSHSHTYLHREL